ncbi:MAG: Wadjet anti-phage system protein JetD domain-containing protein [Rhodocyclaceae bacterium]
MADRHDWTTPAQLRAHTEKLWGQGKLLAALCDAGPVFPLRLPLKGPDSRALSDDFAAVRAWSAALLEAAAGQGGAGYRVELREVRHRVIGTNRLPAAVWLDTPDDAFALIGRRAEARRFRSVLALVDEREPALRPWIVRRPLKTLELAATEPQPGSWPRLLDVVAWLRANPRPGCYLRQVDLAGVDTKFIEQHQGVLAELFDLALPPQAIEPDARGQAGFARRYGFRDKPERVRLRFLDADASPLPLLCDQDLMITAVDLERLHPPVRRVFITENEVNFLAFPSVPRAIVVFGAGYGWGALARAAWLHRCTLHYWGDIDTHGFAILDSLRAHFPHAASFLMDRRTLMAHQPQWGEEPADKRHDASLHRLTDEEATLHDDLRHDRIQPRLRLEQERTGYRWLCEALATLGVGPDDQADALRS